MGRRRCPWLWLLLAAAGAGYVLGRLSGARGSRSPEPERPAACARPLAAALQRHSRFQQLFDLSRPVLLWRGLLTPRLWADLSQVRGPYGWRNVSPRAVATTLRLLNGSEGAELWAAPQELRPPCVRCAVVANGGILRGSRQGRHIDAHDYVFRLNGAVIRGFEKDVGTKTSFYGFTVNTMKNSLHNYRGQGFLSVPKGRNVRYLFIPASSRDYVMLRSALLGVPVPEGPDRGDLPQAYFGPGAPAGKFKLLHPNFIHYLIERFLNSSLINRGAKDIYMPSTGALVLLTALHSCDEVSAYGFITENYQEFSNHYFDKKKKPLKFYANHDLLLEATLWKDLHQAGIMQLYQR